MPFESRFDQPGTLPPPGPIGRLVRLLLGLLCLFGVWGMIAYTIYGDLARTPRVDLLLTFAIALWLLPAVIDIGWAVRFERASQLVVAIAAGAFALLGQLLAGSWWTPALAWLVVAVTVYTLGHLGISFLLSAVLATPGCEMRGIPHLWTVLTGRATQEHYCPGPLDGLDKWELHRREA